MGQLARQRTRGDRTSIIGGGHIFIHSCSAQLISFGTDCCAIPNLQSSATRAEKHKKVNNSQPAVNGLISDFHLRI